MLLTEHAALVDLIPALIEQCTEFEELIGNAGDLVLLHPLTLHRASANPSGRARFIQNVRLSLQEPMDFNRPNPADYSLVELCVLRALGVAERLTEWRPGGPRENGGSDTQWGRVPPRRFRTEREKAEQEARLAVEQAKLAVRTLSIFDCWGYPPEIVDGFSAALFESGLTSC